VGAILWRAVVAPALVQIPVRDLEGQAVAFVPLERAGEPPSTPPAFVESYEHSRELAVSDAVEAATIRVEKFRGELVLLAGGDEKVWPSSHALPHLGSMRSELLVTNPDR
jgi:hypothetical protein